ncbi:MAG TPA: HAD-IA family hydrolase [Opitutaceae bacterium]
MKRSSSKHGAVVFDLDGTLVDSMPMVLRAFAHALAPFRAPLGEMELFLRLGAPPERAFRELLDDAAHVPLALERMVEFSRTHWELIQPFAGAQALLSSLRAQGRDAALWTGRDRRSAEMILAEHGLEPAFATAVCGDDLPTHKPHPQGLLEILDRLRLQAADTLFIGDADVDVLAGWDAGVRTVLIHHGRDVDAAVLAKAWRVVKTPAEAYACVQSDGGE